MPRDLPTPAAATGDFPRAVAGVAVLVGYAAARGLAPVDALRGSGLAPADVERGGRLEVTADQELRVVRTLHRRFGEVGVEVGDRYDATTFGAFGYGLLASRTVGDAMAWALRFIDLSFAFAIPTARVDGDRVEVVLDARGLPGDVRRFLLERDTTAVHRVLDSLVPGGVGASLTWESAQEPAQEPARARLTMAASELDRPLARRSPERLAAAAEACAEVVHRRRARTGLGGDVRVLVAQRLADGAPMGEVAAALAMTERTLRRRLVAEGTTYQELLDEVRSAVAAALLDGRATIGVGEVARRLGYRSPEALVRAHRRWTGRTPRGRAVTPPVVSPTRRASGA